MSSGSKPARNRLRRSCDVCFKSKTKCDDYRPCSQCVRRKCEDRCLTSGQSAGVTDEVQSLVTAPSKRKISSEFQPRKTNGASRNGSPTRGSSSLDISEQYQDPMKSQRLDHQAQTHIPHQVLSKRQSFRTESPLTIVLNYEHQSGDSGNYANGNTLEHTWTAEGPGKGRTHYLWLLRKFSNILPYINEEKRYGKSRRLSVDGPSNRPGENLRTIEKCSSEMLAAIFDELPTSKVCIALMELYFNTYAQIFPILDHNEFEKSYYVVTSSPEVFARDGNFVIMLLLVLVLGNTLLDIERQGISSDTVKRWLCVVQLWQNKIMETAPFGFEHIHTLVLFNLARQVTSVHPESDYICLGSAIRAAMINGTHKPPPLLFGTGYTARVPWTALIELDLQGSLATGLLPTTAPISAQDELTKKSSSLFINELWTALASTIHLRHDILTRLNSELVIKHQHAIDLARELTSIVGPVLKSNRKPENAFAYEYLNFIYKRFLFALHRPFALMDDPAYHFSDRVCSSLSFYHIERICRIHRTTPGNRTPFENLLINYSTMFWDETFQSTMFLCHSLLRTHSAEDEIMDTIMLGEESDRSTGAHGVSSSAIRMALHAYIPIAGQYLEHGSWLAEQAYLVPVITLAYLDVSKQFANQMSTEEWEKTWKDTQKNVVNQYLELIGRFGTGFDAT